MMQQLFKVLLVEDNPGDAFLIREKFKTVSTDEYHLTQVAYLEQAIATLAENSFDIILLDLSLPDSRGLETLKIIKDYAVGIPIVILSGMDHEEFAIQAVKQGAQDYLVKGQVTGEILVHALRYAIERKHIEEQLKTKTVQLEASNQELKAFSYMVSHDLRNPLTVIKGMSALLKQKYETEVGYEREKFYLEQICHSSKRMEQIIENLLILSQVKEQELFIKTVNLSELAQQIMEQLQQQHPTREVNLTIPPQIKAIGDRNLLNHAMENLLHNAWKYTDGKREAQIELGVINSNLGGMNQNLAQLNLEEIEQPNQKKLLRLAYRKLVYFIRDNGIGFNSATAKKLFTPFHRLDNALGFEGTGIGLVIVQSIIHQHNGRVWAEAKPGKGATFYFTLGI